jgi:hypothetical protein
MISRELSNVQFEIDVHPPGTIAFPAWPCPACRHGLLQISSQRLGGNAQVDWAINEGHLNRWDEHGVFCAVMKCVNDNCRQSVAVLGDYATLTPEGAYWVWGRGPDFPVVRQYTVRAVHPSIYLIDIPDNAPSPIVDALKRSFALYWGDHQACAAAIRVAIEAIADNLQARRIGRDGKRVILATHLVDLKPAHPKLVVTAEVVKDKLGNPGAHGDPVDRESVLTDYGLLEIELRRLFMETERAERLDRLRQPPP